MKVWKDKQNVAMENWLKASDDLAALQNKIYDPAISKNLQQLGNVYCSVDCDTIINYLAVTCVKMVGKIGYIW